MNWSSQSIDGWLSKQTLLATDDGTEDWDAMLENGGEDEMDEVGGELLGVLYASY
jgi:hypothetical protein